MRTYLDFEKPVAELEAKVEELRAAEPGGDPAEIAEEIARLELKAGQALKELYGELTPWQKTQVARHPQRPHCLDYVTALLSDFTPMAGDRKYGEDEAIIGGFGRFQGESICVIGHEKGATTESRLRHNFGMARPEGYRKAARLMEMADRFAIPVLALVDTAGAYPGIGAEERGQAEAIARSTEACLALKVPNVAVILGEGGSGGAIAIATANRVLMLEHAIYSVISPEGAASIGAGRRRPSRSSGRHRIGRRGDCRGAGKSAGARPGSGASAAAGEILKHRPQSVTVRLRFVHDYHCSISEESFSCLAIAAS